jgi:protein-S-isoprenylcysteine O-methyltransferase Ste14
MSRDWLYWSMILGLWVVWRLYWIASARDVKVTVRQESVGSRASHIAPLVVGVLLVALPTGRAPLLAERILPRSLVSYWIGVAVIVLGLSFAVWARRHIGRNWSGTVTVKTDHVLVRSGPYAWVRHPIYTGLLTAILGTAIARGDLSGLLGVILCAIAFTIKLRIEERWMRQAFGEAYDRYSKEVPALIPLSPW